VEEGNFCSIRRGCYHDSEVVHIRDGQGARNVTGAPYREVNSKVATVPKLKVEDKNRVNNSRRIKTGKLNIVKLEASLNLVLSRKGWLSK